MDHKSEKSPAWYYCAMPMSEGLLVALSDEEAQHGVRVKRLQADDSIVLFDGAGTVAHATVVRVSGKPLKLEVRIEQTKKRIKRRHCELAFSIPKGDRQSTLIDMAVQLGVSHIQPLSCRYSSVTLQKNMLARWQRIAMSACKQSRCAHLPVINETIDFVDYLSSVKADMKAGHCRVFYGDQEGHSILQLDGGIMNNISRVVTLVGPEGGFDQGERDLLEASGAIAVTASTHVLRTETAGVAMLALIQQLS